MERYYIIPHNGATNISYEGNYSEALDFAAELFEIPEGEPVSEYADILTESEYEEMYGDE